MANAYSISNVLAKSFKTLDFDGVWEKAVGHPQPTGAWLIYGSPKNGKTTFALQLCKYLSSFRRVAYNSVEEGLSLTFRMAIERADLSEVSGRMVILDKEPLPELVTRLKKHKSPDVVVIDSIQFADMTFQQYKMLKSTFPSKLFIFISHINAGVPDGACARRIWRDANVYFKVEGYRAFPASRFGGGNYIDVWPERAAEIFDVEPNNNGNDEND